MGGARNGSFGGARQHRGSGGNGGMVVSTAPAASNNVYYHYVPVPNPPLYYTQPQQYPTSPVSDYNILIRGGVLTSRINYTLAMHNKKEVSITSVVSEILSDKIY